MISKKLFFANLDKGKLLTFSSIIIYFLLLNNLGLDFENGFAIIEARFLILCKIDVIWRYLT